MGSDEVRISVSVEPSHCVLRLAGALGVADSEELRLTALELCAHQKDVQIDWSGATQIDAGIAQVLLSLHAGLEGQNRSFHCTELIPEPIQSWLRMAGLADILGNTGPWK
jgi:anti-anti-sigma regulatory factor